MNQLHIAAAFALAASVVQGHFTFVRLAVNGEWQEPLRFIRNKTSPYEEASTPNTNVNTRLYNFPTYPTDYPESVRCGRGNLAHGAETEVLTVKAGDTIEVAHVRADPSEWNRVRWDGCAESRGSCYVAGTPPHEFMDFNHQGPLLAHLSKVPDGEDVHSYDGSGEWTKIHSLGLELNDNGSIHWLAYNYQGLPGRFVFKIPEQTPAGEYLLRLDLIWPALVYLGSKGDDAQLYPTCAQIVVESAIDGDLPEGIRIPEGIMGIGVPGMSSSLSMYRDQSLDEGYVYPVGLLWTGEELIEDKPKI